jgi:NAD(P)-dependent dehydrogenase (short-subunit alcohol dehydrogenase family)
VISKTAIVTGASRGIGRATAIRLAKDFSALALAARGEANLQEVAGEVEKAGAQAIILDLDLADPSAGKKVVEETLKAFGRIDALRNIAGAVPQIDIFEMSDQQWHDGAELKLHGARRLTIATWPALKESRGSVVFMSGDSALFLKPAYAAVATINAAIVALAKAFSEQGVKDGVQINSVLPGPIMTDRRRSYLEPWAPLHGMTVEEAMVRFPEEAGIARYGQPEEIADLMAFLVSPGARFMTGTMLRMDGGEVKTISNLFEAHFPYQSLSFTCLHVSHGWPACVVPLLESSITYRTGKPLRYAAPQGPARQQATA